MTDDPALTRAVTLAQQSLPVLQRALQTGDDALLDTAVALMDEALDYLPDGHPFQAGLLTNAGIALRTRFSRRGDRGDLDRAVQLAEAAVRIDGSRRPDLSANLVNALRTRYEQAGDPADLDRAIRIGDALLEAVPSQHPNRSGYLANHGAVLRLRYDLTADRHDLDAAIAALRAALDADPTDPTDRGTIQAGLGAALRRRFERLGAAADLDEAVELAHRSVAATPPGHPNRPAYLNLLGNALRIRFERARRAADVDHAIEFGEAALAAAPPGDAWRPVYASNLVLAWQARGRPDDLDRAVELGRVTAAAERAGHPGHAASAISLGLALQRRYELGHHPADLDEAVAVLRSASQAPSAAATLRAQAARGWGEVAAGGSDWDTAAEGYATAIELLATVAPRSLGRPDQEFWLSHLAGLGSSAAACCLQAGRVERAVELWEQGRGVLLGQALDLRTDLTPLEAEHPDLAAEFERLRDQLGHVTDDVAIDRRRALTGEFDGLVERIRRLPGHQAFLRPQPLSELLGAAAEGPVVLVNVTDIRSDALILTRDGPSVVPLPGVTPAAVRERVAGLLTALIDDQDGGRDDAGRGRVDAVLPDVLAWLWNAIVEPVLLRLGLTEPLAVDTPPGGLPRLWWCPAGVLAFLPLHAACGPAGSGRSALDRVVTSYTGTLRALVHSRRPVADPVEGRLVTVAMPRTPGEPDLPGTVAEAVHLRRRFGGGMLLLHGELRPREADRLGVSPSDDAAVPSHGTADHTAVTAALAQHRWAHFACHAANDPTDPSAARLLLVDHATQPLTVTELARLRLDDAQFAFLSACATAQTGVLLADEAIQLAAAFQLAGFRRVVGTLWPVLDRQAARMAADLYDGLIDGGVGVAAHALHRAARRMRERAPDRPSLWAAHVHHGA